MFGIDFYPSSQAAKDALFEGEDVSGKVCYDPSAGKGDLVTECLRRGAAQTWATELDPILRRALWTIDCYQVGEDFLTVTADQVASVQFIVMNPPYSKGDRHVLHAFAIAPAGCRIHALVNWETVKNPYSRTRSELASLIETYGSARNLGKLFKTAERRTEVEVALVRLDKPGAYSQEFDGFFLEEEPERQVNGIASYNLIRDVVNRYVECVKIYDQQLETAVRLNELRADYLTKVDFGNSREEGPLAISVSRGEVPLKRNQFKKQMQKSGWAFVFKRMNLQKYATKGLKEDINKFVETQEQVPFTMRNVYRLLEIVVGTQEARMDQAALEAFDKVTRHCDENRWQVEGWKTNSHYLLTRRFIMPNVVKPGWHGEVDGGYGSGNQELLEDLVKVLCHLTGKDYNDERTLYNTMHSPLVLVNQRTGAPLREKDYDFVLHLQGSKEENLKERLAFHPEATLRDDTLTWGKWSEWSFFRVKPFKKGTLHLEFKDERVWATFNQRIAKIKNYPLPEDRPMTAYQRRQHGRKAAAAA